MADQASFHQAPSLLSRRALLAASLAAAGTGTLGSIAWGQVKKKKEDAEIPAPEPVSLETKDGVQLKATYYASTKGKSAVPVLMVHGLGERHQQDEYKALALTLQHPDRGHAVLTVDLRGHGLSTQQRQPDGGAKDIDFEKMRTPDIEKMVLDLERCKKFLVEKNNEGKLNAAALCLLAAESGCIIALRWAALDWSVANLASLRQGKDVQGIALLSPVESHKGVTARKVITESLIRGKPISKIICVGQADTKALQEARSLHKTWERYHGKVEDDAEKQDLFFKPVDTKLQGTKLLDRAFSTPRDLVDFIHTRLVARMDNFAWEERKNPLGGN